MIEEWLSHAFHEAFEKMLIVCGVTIHNTHEYRIEQTVGDWEKRLIHNDVCVAKIWIEQGHNWFKVQYARA
jgi:hypothetical protein